MQFREVKDRIQVLASQWDTSAKRSRQIMVFSLKRYGHNEPVTAESLSETSLPVEKREEAAAEINRWIAEREAANAATMDRYLPHQTAEKLTKLVALMERDPTAADASLDTLAEALRRATAIVANRNRSLKVAAAKAAKTIKDQ